MVADSRLLILSTLLGSKEISFMNISRNTTGIITIFLDFFLPVLNYGMIYDVII